MKKRISLISLILAGLIALTSCSAKPNAKSSNSTEKTAQMSVYKATDASKSPAAAKNRKDSMVIGISDMTAIWCDQFGTNSYDWYCCETMFDDLIRADASGKPVENACTYKISSDGLTYTFTIKDGVKYWDGTAATAKDIEFMYYVICDPNYDGATDFSTVGIKGFDAYKNGKATTITGIKVVDDKNIQITLDKPYAPALWSLGLVPLMEKSHYDANFKKGDAKTVENNLSKPMGTGQYKFVSYTPGTLKLIANDDYFKGKPSIKNLEFSAEDEGKELQRVQAGETDMDNATCNDDDMTSLQKSGFINAYYFPTNGYGMIQWNLQDAKYKDVRVRQALAYALNRAAVVKKVYDKYGVINNVPIPQASWGYSADGLNTYSFNLDKAKELLKEAGWTLNSQNQLVKDGKPFTIDFIATNSNPVTSAMLPMMKEDYKKLGITVNIESADWSTLYKNYTNAKSDATFLGNALASPDPDQSTMFLTGSTQNYYKYSNSNLDTLIKQELAETDTAKRTQIFYKINKILNDDLPVMPIYQRDDLWVMNSRITNVPNFGAFHDPFLDIWQYKIAG